MKPQGAVQHGSQVRRSPSCQAVKAQALSVVAEVAEREVSDTEGVDLAIDRLATLEAEYHAKLVSALRKCAAGKWRLLGHNEHLDQRPSKPEAVSELFDLSRKIDPQRERLGLRPFPLHEFIASRGPVDANAPGEPKQAQRWLTRLDS